MSKFTLKKRSKKAGLPPGSLVYIGERKTESIEVNLISYDENNILGKQIEQLDELLPFKERSCVNWINIEGIHKTDLIEKLGQIFNIHLLALEDILNTDQRPKIENFEENIYVILKMLSFDEKKKEIITEQVSIIFGNNFVISFQEGIEGDVFNSIRDRLRNNRGKIRKLGTDFLVYSLIDAIVDNYFLILEKLGEKMESLQEQLLNSQGNQTIKAIDSLKREMIFLHRSVWPLREVISGVLREESPLIKEATKIYFKDIYDHTIQVMDTVETYRDILSGMLEIHLSNTNNKLNETMRTLTIISTIFMPPTFIAGIYGMNFEHLPELKWSWGYPFALGMMLLTTLSMLMYFRFKRWI